TPPCRIWEGYTGSLNGGLCTSRGRLVLPFARLTKRAWRDRGEGLDAFTFAGTSSSMAIYSDDGGDTWHQSPSELKVQTPAIGTYGAVEPVVIELTDGRLWMLIRTQVGRLYESFSDDGALWSHPQPTPLISSDSPVGLERLPDGRLVLLWNKCHRYPYAHGGRHVLHGALSADEGATWTGHREVARDPHRDEPPPPGGDHGTAYPFPVVAPDGSVLVTTGQGAGRVCILRIDPAWLDETRHSWPEGVTEPAEEWSIFGCRGVELGPARDHGGETALSMAQVDGEWPAAAVWNFPLAARGRLELRLMVKPKFGGALILLTDHYSVPFDPEDVYHAVLGVALDAVSDPGAFEGDTLGVRAAGPRELPPGIASCQLDPGIWHQLQITWDLEQGAGQLHIDGRAAAALPRLRVSEGMCYLRLRSTAIGPDEGLTVASVAMVAE
ncbi:sialidase family protein, partial [Candidatus Latescibacterota bacterium]